MHKTLAGQVEFRRESCTATFVGYRLAHQFVGLSCDSVDGEPWKKYHFHFVSDDREIGGHVLDYSIKSAKLEWMILQGNEIHGEI